MKSVGEWKSLGRYGTVGLELVLSILVGFFGGRWIDAKVGAHGWITVLGFVVGCYAGFRSLYKVYKQMQVAAKREEDADKRKMAEYLAQDEGLDKRLAPGGDPGKKAPGDADDPEGARGSRGQQ
jgi:ATP synthase protein I